MRTATRFLEKRMVQDIERITGGRYRRVRVDDRNLAIEVFAPERGDWVDVSSLSQGTLDQIYLAARLGLVRLVTGDRRPPLIFDDPFVTFDDARAARAVDMLRELNARLPGHLPDDLGALRRGGRSRSSSSRVPPPPTPARTRRRPGLTGRRLGRGRGLAVASSSGSCRPWRGGPAISAAGGRPGAGRYSGWSSSPRSSASSSSAVVAILRGEPVPGPADLGWASLAGLAGGLGIVCLYQGLATARITVVAPITGVLAATIPVTVGWLGQGVPSGVADRRHRAGPRRRRPRLDLERIPSTTGRPASGTASRPASAFGLFNVFASRFSPGARIRPARRRPDRRGDRAHRRHRRRPGGRGACQRSVVPLAIVVGLGDMAGTRSSCSPRRPGGSTSRASCRRSTRSRRSCWRRSSCAIGSPAATPLGIVAAATAIVLIAGG